MRHSLKSLSHDINLVGGLHDVLFVHKAAVDDILDIGRPEPFVDGVAEGTSVEVANKFSSITIHRLCSIQGNRGVSGEVHQFSEGKKNKHSN